MTTKYCCQIFLVLSRLPSSQLINLVDCTLNTPTSIAMWFLLAQLLLNQKFSQLNLFQIHLRSQSILMMDYEGAVFNICLIIAFFRFFTLFFSHFLLGRILLLKNNFLFLFQINFLPISYTLCFHYFKLS